MKSKLLITALFTLLADQAFASIHIANGIKVGEVDADSAIVWTRLTEQPERNTGGIEFTVPKGVKARETDIKRFPVKQQPAYNDLSIMQGSVIG